MAEQAAIDAPPVCTCAVGLEHLASCPWLGYLAVSRHLNKGPAPTVREVSR